MLGFLSFFLFVNIAALHNLHRLCTHACRIYFPHDANRDGGFINCHGQLFFFFFFDGVSSCVSCWLGLEQAFTCCITLLFVEIRKEKVFSFLFFSLLSPSRSWGCVSPSHSFKSVCLSVCSSSYLSTWMQSAVAHVFGSCSTAVKLCRTWFLLFMKAAMAARWAAQRENSFQLALRQSGSAAQT